MSRFLKVSVVGTTCLLFGFFSLASLAAMPSPNMTTSNSVGSDDSKKQFGKDHTLVSIQGYNIKVWYSLHSNGLLRIDAYSGKLPSADVQKSVKTAIATLTEEQFLTPVKTMVATWNR